MKAQKISTLKEINQKQLSKKQINILLKIT